MPQHNQKDFNRSHPSHYTSATHILYTSIHVHFSFGASIYGPLDATSYKYILGEQPWYLFSLKTGRQQHMCEVCCRRQTLFYKKNSEKIFAFGEIRGVYPLIGGNRVFFLREIREEKKLPRANSNSRGLKEWTRESISAIPVWTKLKPLQSYDQLVNGRRNWLLSPKACSN